MSLLIQSLPAVFPIGFAVFLLVTVGPESGEALGFVNVMKDLPAKTGKGGVLYVFALP